jgi:hypothetical protein
MAIQNVNGRNVYVLAPKAPTGKTTSGRNWATLYSDLRWQVWEAQKENEAKKIELDLMSFKVQKEYYDQQKKFLQNRIADLQDIKLKSGVSGDGTSKAIDQTLRAYDLSAPKSLGGRGASGPKITVTDREGVDIVGRKTGDKIRTISVSGQPEVGSALDLPAGVQLKEGTDAQAGTVAGPPQGLVDTTSRLDARMNRLLDEEDERRKSGEVLGTGDIDAQIQKLEDQLSGLAAPQFQTDTDLLNRTQRSFEQNVGVIGQGGGPFGLAPRSRRLAPRVDQPRATAVAQDLVAKGTAEAPGRRQLEEERKALLLRREDLMASDEGSGGDMLGAAIKVIDEQLADVNAQLSQTIAQKFMADESFIERAPGEFLLRGQNREPRAPRPDDSPRTRDVRPPRQRRNIDLDFLSGLRNLATEGIPSVYFGSGEDAEAGLSSNAPQTAPFGGAPDSASIIPDLQTNVGFGATTMPQSRAPREPSESDSNFRKTIQRLRTDIGGMQPGDSAPSPVTISGEAGLQSPPFVGRGRAGREVPPQAPPVSPGVTVPTVITPMQPSATVSPEQGRENAAADLYASYAPRKTNADTGEETLTPLNKLEKEQIFTKWLEDEDVTSGLDDDGAKKWYNNAVKELKGGQGGKAAPPTSKQRKELYSFNVSSDGLKLAQKPKQLARLAKTSLPEDKRPQHIVIVDKLFETNSGKTNAFRLTYDEISRVFANDPKKRTEAHKYLVAKDVLEGNKREPLA